MIATIFLFFFGNTLNLLPKQQPRICVGFNAPRCTASYNSYCKAAESVKRDSLMEIKGGQVTKVKKYTGKPICSAKQHDYISDEVRKGFHFSH